MNNENLLTQKQIAEFKRAALKLGYTDKNINDAITKLSQINKSSILSNEITAKIIENIDNETVELFQKIIKQIQ